MHQVLVLTNGSFLNYMKKSKHYYPNSRLFHVEKLLVSIY